MSDQENKSVEQKAWDHINKNCIPHGIREKPAWYYSLNDFEAGHSSRNDEVEKLAKENSNLLLAAKSWQREAEIEAEHVKELKDNIEKLELLLSDKSCCCAGCTKHNIALEEKYEVNDEMNK